MVLSHVSVADMERLLLVNKAFNVHTKRHLQGHFAVLMTTYGLDASQTRMAMKFTGSIIAGQTALKFVCQQPLGDDDLNFFASLSSYQLMADELVSQGYRVKFVMGTHPSFSQYNIWAVIRLEKMVAGKRRSCHVFATSHSNPLLTIVRAFTTAQMLLITHNRIHIVYPDLTLNKRAIIPCQPYQDPSVKSTVTKVKDISGRGLGNVVSRMLNEGWDLSYSYKWGGPCGSACSVHQNSFFSESGLHLRFAWDESGGTEVARRDIFGADVRFVLRNCCLNSACRNYRQRL